MKSFSKLVVASSLLFGLAVLAPAQTPEQDVDVIRTETDLTNLLFTVTDKNNRYLVNIQQSDVRVLEDGVPQTLFTFQRETDRVLERVEVAYPAYLGSAPPMTGITSGPGTVAPPREGSTAIWDSIALTCRQVLARSAGLLRRAIILLTDGQDGSSRLGRSAAIDQAIATETVIYAIGIGDPKYEGVNKGALREVAERTGGRAFFPKKQDDLKAAFAEIEQELRSQYLLAYTSTNKKRDGGFRKMTLEITNPDLQKEKLQLRYRPGYFAKRSGQ